MAGSDIFKKAEHPVTAVWLCTEGRATVVRLEINGKWTEVIRDYATNISHIVESAGIQQMRDHGKLVAGAHPCQCPPGVCRITMTTLHDYEFCKALRR